MPVVCPAVMYAKGMRRFWVACVALGWSFAVTMVFANRSSSSDHGSSADSGSVAYRWSSSEGRQVPDEHMPSLLDVSPVAAIPLLSCLVAVLAWRWRPVQVGAAIPIFLMCFLGYALYLPAAIALVAAGLDHAGAMEKLWKSPSA